MHDQRASNRASLSDLPLIVPARTYGGYDAGMCVSPDVLEKERRALQADLARLSQNGRLTYAEKSGHNIHVENPDLVVRSISDVASRVHNRPAR